MTPLPAGNVQHARANRQTQELDETSYFLAVTLESEKKTVLPEIMGVEG